MTVTASVLSYNSHATLPRVIEGIEAQTRSPDRIIIVDNGSGQETLDYLRQLPQRYEVIFLPENVGLGAGHNSGWRKALDDPGCDYIWTLENDSIPPEGLLDQLLKVATQLKDSGTSFGAICPRQTHPGRPAPPMSGPPIKSDGLTFNGILIPRSSISAIGMIREDFFIDQDDWEFAKRLIGAGLPIYTDPESLIIHLGKGRETPSTLRLYYRVRNGTYLRKSLNQSRFPRTESLARCGAAIIRTLLKEPDKWRRIKARIVATRDGLKGDLGKKEYSFLDG